MKCSVICKGNNLKTRWFESSKGDTADPAGELKTTSGLPISVGDERSYIAPGFVLYFMSRLLEMFIAHY